MTNSSIHWTDTSVVDALLSAGSTTSVFSSLFSGGAATRDAMENLKKRQKLNALIDIFYTQGLSWNWKEVSKISWCSVVASKRFIELLPDDRALPKIAPDGEGGVMMVWQQPKNPLLVTVNDVRIHAVTSSGSATAKYIDDIAFDGASMRIPEKILEAVPVL